MSRHFIMSMESVSDVNSNVANARELKDMLINKIPHSNGGGTIDPSKTIAITIGDAMDIIRELDMYIDRILSMKLAKGQ